MINSKDKISLSANKDGQFPPFYMEVLDYCPEFFYERKIDEEDFSQMQLWYFPITKEENENAVTWINLPNVYHTEKIAQLGQLFSIHTLLQEDIVTPNQRPKIEDFGNYLFMIIKTIDWDDSEQVIVTKQVSFILGENYLLSFQEIDDGIFESIRERIRKPSNKIRQMGTDYLLYVLLDIIVDQYFIAIEKIHKKMNLIEERLLSDPSSKTLEDIHYLKQEIIALRGMMLPSKEVLRSLQKGDSHLINESILFYFRDVYEHIFQAMDMFSTFQDMLTDMLSTYISSINNKMNEVMKVLTIMSTIFIPLTFISSLYGMNFQFMPELKWKWGYWLVISSMVFIFMMMIFFFKKKKWL